MNKWFDLSSHAGQFFDEDGGGTGTSDGDSDAGADTGDGENSRTFTQEELNEIVETRLAKERRKAEGAREKLLQRYEREMEQAKNDKAKLKELTAERDALLKEGQTETQALRSKYERDTKRFQEEAQTYREKFEASEKRRRSTEIRTVLSDVAAPFLKEDTPASDFVDLFSKHVTFEPELDDNGKPTGGEVLVLSYDVTGEDGEKAHKTFTDPDKWMEAVYADERKSYLFRGNPASGSGADPSGGLRTGTKKAFYTESELKRLTSDVEWMSNPENERSITKAVSEGRIRPG